MGRSWGQRPLIKCNWILQEGSRVHRPCSCVERAWEQRFLESTANPISYFVFVRKKEKGIHHSESLFVFPLEKGKGNKDFMRSVYCWSIHLLYLRPAQENHTRPRLPCSVYFRMTTKCREHFGLFFLTFITTLPMKNQIIFHIPFSSYNGSEKLKINQQVFRISCFQNGNPWFLIKLHPRFTWHNIV